jgi:hypothetical protein
MQPLTVPAPELVFDPPAGPPELEKPVTVRLAAVRFPDGRDFSNDHVRTLGVFIYRGAVGSEEIWDEKNQVWAPSPADAVGLAALKPLPLTAAEGEPSPWKGTLVAAGQKDGAGNPRFAKAVSGTPVYRLRAFAHGVRDGVEHRGVGSPSPDLQFISATENQRFTIAFDTETAKDAQRARAVLKNSSLQPAGFLEIRAAGSQEIEIANCNASGTVLARVLISANGDIRLAPAAGRQIVLEGDLEARHVSYLPQGGGARQTL